MLFRFAVLKFFHYFIIKENFSMPNITESSWEKISKRMLRCAGCSTPISKHDWGIHSKFCEGQEKSFHSKCAAAAYADIDEEIVALEDEMNELELKEEKQAKCKKCTIAA